MKQANDGHQRHLICGSCHTSWTYKRIGCAYCGNEELNRLRLYEIDAITVIECETFLQQSVESVNNLRRRYSFPIPAADNRIALDTLSDLAVKQFEKKNITYEKLTYLLNMSGLQPEDVGIDKPADYIPPTDDELDSIMEE